MHMLIEVHHLEAVKLLRNFLYRLFFSRLNHFNARIVPLDIRARCFLVLSTGLDSAAGYFAIVDVLDLVVAHWAGEGLSCAHLDAWYDLLQHLGGTLLSYTYLGDWGACMSPPADRI